LKVLIIRLSALGDVVHTLPAAARIKSGLIEAGHTDTTLSWLVEPPNKDLLVKNDLVDEVILFPKKALKTKISSPEKWGESISLFSAFVQELKQKRFDAVIDFQGLLKSSIPGYISGSKIRIGYSKVKELSHLFLTHKLQIEDYFAEGTHIVNRHLLLADLAVRVLTNKYNTLHDTAASAKLTAKVLAGEGSAADTPELVANFPLPRPEASVFDRFAKMLPTKQNKQPRVVLIPGTTWDTKIWAPEKWSKLGQELIKASDTRPGAEIVIVGGDSEAQVNASIFQYIRNAGSSVVDLTGKTSLVDLIALFEGSDLVIGGDTGPMHLACATNHPKVIGLYGATPSKRNGPYGEGNLALALNLSCQPCNQMKCPLKTTACLVDMSVEQVLAEALKMI